MYRKEILFTEHARQRMSARNITTDEVLNCYYYGKAGFSKSTGHYLYRDSKIQVVIEINKENKFALDVVTVMYTSQKTNRIKRIAEYYETDERTVCQLFKQVI